MIETYLLVGCCIGFICTLVFTGEVAESIKREGRDATALEIVVSALLVFILVSLTWPILLMLGLIGIIIK